MTKWNNIETDELLYSREESPNETKSRLYYENAALELKMMKDLESSSMGEPTHSFCLFSVLTAKLDYRLNEFYDNSVILTVRSNPMVDMKMPTAEQKKIWSYRDGKIKGFADLSLGQKHQALQLIDFITDDDKKQYKKTMAKLDKVIKKRNRIVHSLFDPNVSSADKLKMIQDANKICSEVLANIDVLSRVFNGYVLKHVAEYYSS